MDLLIISKKLYLYVFRFACNLMVFCAKTRFPPLSPSLFSVKFCVINKNAINPLSGGQFLTKTFLCTQFVHKTARSECIKFRFEWHYFDLNTTQNIPAFFQIYRLPVLQKCNVGKGHPSTVYHAYYCITTIQGNRR